MKMFQRKKLFEFMQFCIAESSSYRDNLSLYDWLKNSQFKDTPNYIFPHAGSKVGLIEEQFRIKAEDVEFIEEIISLYKDEMLKKYFNAALIWYHNMTKVEYFLLSLQNFLVEYFYDSSPLWNKKEVYICKNNEEVLTDFGVALYKTLLIVEHYRLNFVKGQVDKHGVDYRRYETIKSYISSRVIGGLR